MTDDVLSVEEARAAVLAECFWCAEAKDDPVHSGDVSGVEREGTDGLGPVMDKPHDYLALGEGAQSLPRLICEARAPLEEALREIEEHCSGNFGTNSAWVASRAHRALGEESRL